MAESTCRTCGKPFKSRCIRKGVYTQRCSNKCRGVAMRKGGQEWRLCKQCGAKYFATNPNRKYCTPKCSTESHRGQTFIDLACANCGKQYQRKPSGAKRSLYCSTGCKNQGARKKSAGTKRCSVCGDFKPEGEFRLRWNEKVKRKVRSQPCRQCEKRKASTPEGRAYATKKAKEYHAKARRTVIAAYGHKCECCGETEFQFLCVDHIHGDGGIERRQGIQGLRLWRKLIRDGFPKDRYRLLCHNCNQARGYYGQCPHELKTE